MEISAQMASPTMKKAVISPQRIHVTTSSRRQQELATKMPLKPKQNNSIELYLDFSLIKISENGKYELKWHANYEKGRH